MKPVLVSIFRWIFGYVVFIVGGTIVILSTFVPLPTVKFMVGRLFCRLLLWSLGVQLRVEGEFPNDQAYIFMSNHASFIDMFILVAISRDKFTGVMAAEQMKYPFWSWIVKRYGAIPIDRSDRGAAVAAIQAAEDRLLKGYHVAILPEGTRTTDGKLGPLKKGGFHMALNTGAPIVLIGIEGSYRFKPKTSWLLRPGPVTVRIGPILPAERYKVTEMEVVMELVRRQLTILSGEAPQANT